MSAADLPAPRLEPVGACPVCDRCDAIWFFTSHDRMHGVPGSFTYRRCRGCRTVFQDPRVVEEDLARLYPGAYYTHRPGSSALPASVGAAAGRGLRSRLRAAVQHAQTSGPEERRALPWWGRLAASSRWMRERAFFDLAPDEMLPRRMPPGRAMDVGCGSGALMLRLAALGWDVMGIEPDAAAAEVARERTGAQVRVAAVADLAREELGGFDLVTASHVLEHLPSPRQALRILAGLLRPGGRLVALYPNPDALGARAFGDCWFAWDAPRHLVLPALDALDPLLEGTGLRVGGVRTLARWAADHALMSMAYRRGEGPPDETPGLWHRGFAGLGRLLVGAGVHVGEEILLRLEPRT